MECTRIKERLSEYVDGVLDAQTETRVEKHLSTCKGCKEELAGLKALVKELSTLESVEAPKDFLDKVHERIEPRFSLRKLLRTLFVPARIKIPLELATAAAMAFLLVGIVKLQQPRQPMVNGPGISRELKAIKKPDAASAKPTAEESTFKLKPSPETVAVQSLERAGGPIELALLLKPEVSDRVHAPSEGMDTAAGPRKAEGETRVFMHALPKAKMKMGALQEEKGAAGLPPKEIAALKHETMPPLSYIDQALPKARNVIELAGGKVVSTEREEDSGKPPSIHAEIPAEHYSSFCEGLRKLGNFQSTPPALPETDKDVVQVHIRLISAK